MLTSRDTFVDAFELSDDVRGLSRQKRRALPAPPPAWPRPDVIAPRSPVGMLAHEMTRQIADHMAAARSVVTLLDTEVVSLEDETAARAPALVLPERPAPARPRAAGIRRSVILPWPAALMLVAIAGGVTFEHVQRGNLREVVKASVDSTRAQLGHAAERLHL